VHTCHNVIRAALIGSGTHDWDFRLLTARIAFDTYDLPSLVCNLRKVCVSVTAFTQ
jgi:hypothetical protein